MSQPDPAPYAFLLPELLTGALRRPRGPRAVRVPDARTLLRGFFAETAGPWVFEARLRQPENLEDPHRLAYANWANLELLAPEGVPWPDVQMLDSRHQELLAAIPPEADLLRDGAAVEEPMLALLVWCTEEGGLTVTAATGLLYQKRPQLVPIIDRNLRLALNVPAPQTSRRVMLRQVLRALQAVAAHPENRASLDRLMLWLQQEPSASRHLALSRMRLVNLIAGLTLQEMLDLEREARPRGRRRRPGLVEADHEGPVPPAEDPD